MINVAEIQRRMDALNLTPGRIGRELGITERGARLVIFGKAIPSWEHLIRIANLLGCTPRDLILKEKEN